MYKFSDIRIPHLNIEAVKTGFLVGFASMTSAAIFNTVSWIALGEAGAPGKSGFILALSVSVLAGLLSGYMNRRLTARLERVSDHAKAIASGDMAAAFITDADAADPLHQQLNLIAEAQLKRIEEFHRLLEDSRIREERLYEALDLMEDEIAVYDPTGMLVCVNKAFTKHCNAIGAPVGPGMLRREILSAIANAPTNGVPQSERDMWLDHQFHMRELALSNQKPVDTLQRDGRHMRFTIIETPLKNQIEITTDISDAVSSFQEVERCRRETDAAEKIKTVTVSRLMSTITTPMTGVLAAAELLNETELTQNQQNKLDIIRRSSGTLLGIVQDMMDMSDHLPKEVPVEPAKLVAVEVNRPRRAILLVRSPELLERVTGVLQEDSVQPIALETIDLVLELLADVDGESVHIDFVMSDDLSAIAQLREWSSTVLTVNRPQIIDLNHVMTDGFAQVVIDKDAVKADDSVETIAPEPKTVAVTFPVHTQPITAKLKENIDVAEAAEPFGLKTRKHALDVMIVEDNDVNQIFYDQIMSNCGYQYLIVSSGIEGVNTALREKPRLILMDISMPGLNGLEATRSIRDQISGGHHPMIIGMTGHLLSGDREKCLAAGMDDYALKPTAPGPLRAQIASWLNSGVQQAKTG